MNDRYLYFVQTRGLISLVNDNHVDNKFKSNFGVYNNNNNNYNNKNVFILRG